MLYFAFLAALSAIAIAVAALLPDGR